MGRAILIWMFGVSSFLSCTTDPGEVNALFTEADPGIERAEDFQMIYSDSARIKARIEGPVLLHYLDPAIAQDEFPEGLKVRFYNTGGQIESWLAAKYAIRLTKQQKVVLKDSVVMRNIRGEKLQTAELIWDELAGMVKTDKFAKITRADGSVLYCYGFISNEQFSDYTLLSIEGPVNIDAFNEGPE